MTRTAAEPAPTTGSSGRGLWLIGIAIVLTALNLRTAVNSVGPVLQELESGLHLSSGLAGLVTALPVLCFAALGFAGPPLSARYRDSHVLAGAMATMTAGLVLRGVAGAFWLFLVGTVLAMTGGALGNVLLPSLVKRYFPHRTGLLVGAYSTAMSIGGAVVAVAAQPIAEAAGVDGWRWAMGVWAVPALRRRGRRGWRSRPGPATSPAGHAAVRHPVPAAQPDGRRHGAVLRHPGHGVLRHRRVGRPVPAGRGAQRDRRRSPALGSTWS